MPRGLYLDHDSGSAALAAALRRTGLFVVTTQEAGNRRLNDPGQLAFAVREGLAVYTANVRDWVQLHRDWLRAGREHQGIIVRTHQQWYVGAEMRSLGNVFTAFPGEAMHNLLLYLENWAART